MPLHHSLPDDGPLMAKFKDGDKEAFRILYDWLCLPLYGYLIPYLKDATEAQDTVSETFYRIFKHREQFTNSYHLRFWAFITARNIVSDQYRKKVQSRHYRREAIYLTPEGTEGEPDWINITSTRQLKKRMFHHLNHLPRQRQTVIRKYFLEEKNTEEIASELSLSPQTVLNHKSRGISTLRKSLRFE